MDGHYFTKPIKILDLFNTHFSKIGKKNIKRNYYKKCMNEKRQNSSVWTIIKKFFEKQTLQNF